jgi:hypothetical protein
MARFAQIVLLLIACATDALIMPRTPSALRMRSRVMALPEDCDIDNQFAVCMHSFTDYVHGFC